MDPILWFDISRGTLIVASLIAALGGFGVLHFGKINSTKQNVEIAKSNERASLANQNAAEANERAEAAKLKSEEANAEAIKATAKTKEMEVDVQTARKETQNAKKETEKLKIEVAKANLKAENAKIEREKLKLEGIKKAAQIKELDTDLGNFKEYAHYANLDMYGLAISGEHVTSELKRKMQKILKKDKSGVSVIIDKNNLVLVDQIIKSYPNFPFGYFAKSQILKLSGDRGHQFYTDKAIEILEITTTIEGHHLVHDRVLKILKNY